MTGLLIEAREEIWPLKQPFRISRGSRTEARVVVVRVSDGPYTGRGEAVPITRYDQSCASVLAQIESMKGLLSLDRQQIQKLLPPGAARNALDCALWDLEAKVSGKRAWELANVPIIPKVETSFTISLDAVDKMAAAANAAADSPLLKLKLGGDELDLARVEAVRGAAPTARLLIDANESWSPSHYRKIVPAGQNRRADGSAALDRARERQRVQIIDRLYGMHFFRNRSGSSASQRDRSCRSRWAITPCRRSSSWTRVRKRQDRLTLSAAVGVRILTF